MTRTAIPGRLIFCSLLGLLAMGAACGGSQVPDIPEGSEIDVSAVPPPPISGGTLLVTHGDLAVAADADRDIVWVADIEDPNKDPIKIALDKNDEPGRLVEDASGKVHVALRRGGAVVTIDPVAGKVTDRRAVCPSPRGIAYDKASDKIHIACEGGELVSLLASGGDATRKLYLARDARNLRDLRDVVVQGDKLLVSRFRAAELLVIPKDDAVTLKDDVGVAGDIPDALTLPEFTPDSFNTFPSPGSPTPKYSPSVAWRTIGLPSGGVMMLHQRGLSIPIPVGPGAPAYYSNAGCDGSIVHASVSTFSPSGDAKGTLNVKGAAAFPSVALPVDIAIGPDGTSFAFVGAGSDIVVQATTADIAGDPTTGNCSPNAQTSTIQGEPIAVAFGSKGQLIVQTRQSGEKKLPAIVRLNGSEVTTIELPGESRADTGHDMFHLPPNGFSGIACASCHPEGHEDGRTWIFGTVDPSVPSFARRTQNIGIGGGLLETAPFHWNGDLPDMNGLMGEVFVKRMGGAQPGPHRVMRISAWLDQIPALPPTSGVDAGAVSRGATLFNDKDVGCATCHTGAKLTNNKTVDVGTGAELQVPSLVSIASRAPFMHDGCAKTLRARLTDPACGGGAKHGSVADLSDDQKTDLIAYLESL